MGKAIEKVNPGRCRNLRHVGIESIGEPVVKDMDSHRALNPLFWVI